MKEHLSENINVDKVLFDCLIEEKNKRMGEHINMQVIVKGIGLCKSYGKGENQVKALNNVNLEIMEGEFVAISGASGSGKSTLLNILGGLETATSGNIYLNGTMLDGLNDDERAVIRREKIGIVFQNYNLVPILTVYENIVMTIQIAGNKIDDAYISQLLSFLELEGLECRLPEQLSGGQQQRVAIARALASKPVLILADEPTGNLDSKSGMDVIRLFRKAVDEFGQTVVMVTHNIEHTYLCDRTLRMQDGELV